MSGALADRIAIVPPEVRTLFITPEDVAAAVSRVVLVPVENRSAKVPPEDIGNE